jgi:hypothetical protein
MRPLLLLATLAVTAFGAGALEAQTPPAGKNPTRPLLSRLRLQTFLSETSTEAQETHVERLTDVHRGMEPFVQAVERGQ